MDVIHATPKDWSSILFDRTPLPYHPTFTLGTDQLDAVAIAVRDRQGERIGTMFPFDEITARLAAEQRERQMVNNLTSAADHLRGNATRVTNSAEQLVQSISSIALSFADADAGWMARDGRTVADSTSVMVDRLNASSDAIGTVVQTIKDIAEQNQSAGSERHDRGGPRR